LIKIKLIKVYLYSKGVARGAAGLEFPISKGKIAESQTVVSGRFPILFLVSVDLPASGKYSAISFTIARGAKYSSCKQKKRVVSWREME
jgi:hypothetical protein